MSKNPLDYTEKFPSTATVLQIITVLISAFGLGMIVGLGIFSSSKEDLRYHAYIAMCAPDTFISALPSKHQVVCQKSDSKDLYIKDTPGF